MPQDNTNKQHSPTAEQLTIEDTTPKAETKDQKVQEKTSHPLPHVSPKKHAALIVALVVGAVFGTGSAVMIIQRSDAESLQSASVLATEKSSTEDEVETIDEPDSPDIAEVKMKTFTSEKGKYSLEYPAQYTLRENKIANGDGGTTPKPNTIELTSPDIDDLKTAFSLRIVHKTASASSTLEDMIAKGSTCDEIKPTNALPYTINKTNALIVKDILCDDTASTELFALENNIFYTISVVSDASWKDVEEHVSPLFETLTFTKDEEEKAPTKSAVKSETVTPTMTGKPAKKKVNTSSWKNYTWKEQAASLKVPGTLKAVPTDDTILDLVDKDADEDALLSEDMKARIIISETNPEYAALEKAEDGDVITLSSGSTKKGTSLQINDMKAITYTVIPDAKQTKKQYTAGIIVKTQDGKYIEVVASRRTEKALQTFRNTLDGIIESIIFAESSVATEE